MLPLLLQCDRFSEDMPWLPVRLGHCSEYRASHRTPLCLVEELRAGISEGIPHLGAHQANIEVLGGGAVLVGGCPCHVVQIALAYSWSCRIGLNKPLRWEGSGGPKGEGV